MFEYVLTRFGFPKILMSDRGMPFLNKTIAMMLEEFQVYYQKSMPYHPQANGTFETFNKILETTLEKVCNAQRNDLDVDILVVLWAYWMTYKKLIGYTPFRSVYGIEVVTPMEYIVPSLWISTLTNMADHKTMEERLAQLMELEEDYGEGISLSVIRWLLALLELSPISLLVYLSPARHGNSSTSVRFMMPWPLMLRLFP